MITLQKPKYCNKRCQKKIFSFLEKFFSRHSDDFIINSLLKNLMSIAFLVHTE